MVHTCWGQGAKRGLWSTKKDENGKKKLDKHSIAVDWGALVEKMEGTNYLVHDH